MKITVTNVLHWPNAYVIKLLRIMKVTTIIILMFNLSTVAGNVYSQKNISIHMEDASLEQIIDEIAEQSEMRFIYNSGILDNMNARSVDLQEKSLEEAMEMVLLNTGLTYEVNNSVVVIKKDPDWGVASRLFKPSEVIDISGRVLDENNNPLPGATVLEKGTRNGTITDIDGNFSLKVPQNTVLQVSFIGYQTQDITVSDKTELMISMKPDASELNEVVVVGYGTTEKKDLTGAVSSVKSKDIADLAPTINADQVLQGKVSGVYVVQETGQPGSAARVRIRGTSSLLGSNQPLYVIDGIPVVAESNFPHSGDAFDRELSQEGLSTPLGNINTADIESINILKDASAAAIYGSRAANGVIIITTKKGTFGDKPQFNVSYSLSTQKAKTTDVLNAEQFREIYTEAVNLSTSTSAFANEVRDGSYFGEADTDWEKEVSRSNPMTRNFDFSVRGGSGKTRYYTSIGVQGQEGVFENSSFDRQTFNLNLDTELSDRLIFGTNLNFSSSKQESPDGGLLNRLYEFRPDIPVFDEYGQFTVSPYYSLENPVALSTASTTNQTLLFLGSAFAELQLMNGLKLKSFISATVNNGHMKSFHPSVTFTGGFRRSGDTGIPGDGFGREGTSQFFSHLWENTLTYDKLITDRHRVNAVVGASWQGDRNKYLQASGEGFPKDEVLTNLSSASKNFAIASNETQSGLASYFGRFNYSYDDRYLVTLSGRVDGSSKFASDNKYAFLPAVAGAWRISNESFMSGVNFIDHLKLRASAGITGQQSFGPYQWRTLYQASFYGNAPAVIRTQMGNSRMKWETTEQLDIGLDFAIFNSRLSGGIGYYQKNTNDLLYFLKVPGSTGMGQVISNLGDTENHGFEVELHGDIVRSEDFNWNLSFNITRNRNKLVRLNDDFLSENGTINPPNTGSILKVGEPIGLIYGYVADGIFQENEEIDELNAGSETGYYQDNETAPGDIRFKDLDGDGRVTSADQTIIGDTQADFFGGFTNTLRYKGFTLSALFTYSVGNDLRWDFQRNGINMASTFLSENKPVDIMNRWTEENPTNQPRAIYMDPNNNDRISSFYIHDASFLRLKNLYISYTLPEKLLSSTKILRNVAIYASATNLLTFTKYPGADPETNNLYNDDVSAGLDNDRYPTPKVYTAGIRVGF